MTRRRWGRLVAIVLLLGATGPLHAQRGRGAPPPQRSAREAAPIDLTGYWVAVVTMNWRWRMVTPPRGDYPRIPLNDEGRKVADAWDPARDEAAGEACRSYGAAHLMSVPGRLHITWRDDDTLQVDADAGTQTRLLYFGDREPPADPAPTWQGMSMAEWMQPRTNAPLHLRPADRIGAEIGDHPSGGSLRVVTTNLRPGYLSKNGAPYSAETVLTEHWDLFVRDNGEQWLTITTQVEDPVYLRGPRVIALPFRKEADGAKWDPTPCSATW